MTTLTNRAPKDTYKDLLQISNANSGIDATLRTIEDGEGTSGPFQISTTAFNILSTATWTSAADLGFTQDNPEILGGDTDGVTYISAGASTVLGGSIRLYGDTHASKPDDIEFYGSATLQLQYDDSASSWDFQANGLTTSGILTIDTINEKTGAAGVTVDGVLLKDGDVTAGTVLTDTINEKTSANGVVIEGVTLKDSDVSGARADFTDTNGIPVKIQDISALLNTTQVTLGSGTSGFPTGSNGDLIGMSRGNSSTSVFLASGTGSGNAVGLRIDSNQVCIPYDDVDPNVTETQDLGSASKEWDNLFVQNSPTVSDVRKKNDEGPVDEKLIDLMRQLDPRIFSRKDTTIPALEDSDGNILRESFVVKHGRPHTGFMAQAVKAKMNELGIEDWAGYAYHEEEDVHMLRLLEFIAPILAYIQSVEKKVDSL